LVVLCGLQPSAAIAGEQVMASDPLDHLTLVVPAGVGAGWDLTARAMKEVMEGEGIVHSVEIDHAPGGSGLPGLEQFVDSRKGDDRSLLIGGMFMVGAAVSKNALPLLGKVIPIAQLTSDADVVVVPASSPYQTLDDLIEAMRRDPGAIRWAGAAVGGSDHPTIWQLARAAGIAPELMHYESLPGGSDVATEVASGRFSAGIDAYSEFDGFIRGGRLRGLAMVSRQPLKGVDIPTFRQLGIVSVSIANWCGAFAPPGLGAASRARLEAAIQQMAASPRWHSALKQLHLRNAYLEAGDFAQLVREEQTRIAKSEAATRVLPSLLLLSDVWAHRVEWVSALMGGVLAVLAAFCWQRLAARRREDILRRTLQEVSQEVERRTREALQRTQDMEDIRLGMHAQIEREFDRWELTCAERSVAHLMLKGMSFKEIARARSTSDRTVRQQAQALYRKAGLDGRTDLAAYFLEGVLGGSELQYPRRT
jgi:putative tricarboxylic transport membrane protein